MRTNAVTPEYSVAYLQSNSPEVYFLMLHFLKHSPLRDAASVLERKMEELGLLSHHTDPVTGEVFSKKYDDLLREFDSVPPTHLLDLLNQLLRYNAEDRMSKATEIQDDRARFDVDLFREDEDLSIGERVSAREGPAASKTSPLEITERATGSLIGAGSFSLLWDSLEEREEKRKKGENADLTGFYANGRSDETLPLPFWKISGGNREYSENEFYIYAALREHMERFPLKTRIPASLTCNLMPVVETVGHRNDIFCVCFDRSGERVFTGSDDYTVKVWSTHTGMLLKTLRGHLAAITDLAVNFYNTLLASSSSDGKVRIWSLKNDGAPIAVINVHRKDVTSISWSTRVDQSKLTSSFLLVSSMDSTISMWKIFDPHVYESIRSGELGNIDPREVMELESAMRMKQYTLKIDRLEGHKRGVHSIEFANTGCSILALAKDHTCRVWFMRPGNRWDSYPLVFDRGGSLRRGSANTHVRCNDAAWTCDDVYIVTTAKNESSVRVFDAKTLRLVWDSEETHSQKGHTKPALVVRPHPTDGRIFASGCFGGVVILWDIETKTSLARFDFQKGSREQVTDLAFSYTGSQLAVVGTRGTLTLASYRRGRLMERAPPEQFFASDANELIQDGKLTLMRSQLPAFGQGKMSPDTFTLLEYGNVIDATTQLPPSLIPKSPLVNYSGQLYLQQPGENTHSKLLVKPLFVLGPEVRAEHAFRQLIRRRFDEHRLPVLWDASDHDSVVKDMLERRKRILEDHPSHGRKRRRRQTAGNPDDAGVAGQALDVVHVDAISEFIEAPLSDIEDAHTEDPDFSEEEMLRMNVESSNSSEGSISSSYEESVDYSDEEDDLLHLADLQWEQRRQSRGRERNRDRSGQRRRQALVIEDSPASSARRRSARLNPILSDDLDEYESDHRPRRSSRLLRRVRTIAEDDESEEETQDPDQEQQETQATTEEELQQDDEIVESSQDQIASTPGQSQTLESQEDAERTQEPRTVRRTPRAAAGFRSREVRTMKSKHKRFMRSPSSRSAGWLLQYESKGKEYFYGQYVPQMNDNVVIFTEKYLDYLAKVGDTPSDMNSIFPESNPFVGFSIPRPEYGIKCTIVGIDYGRIGDLETLMTCLILDLEFVEFMSADSEYAERMQNIGQLSIAFHPAEMAEIVVPIWRYELALARDYDVGDVLGVMMDGDVYSVEVTDVGEKRTWEALEVKWIGYPDYPLQKLSAWEVFSLDDDMSENSNISLDISEDQRLRLFTGLAALFRRISSRIGSFRDAVSHEDFPNYYEIIEYPLWLDLIVLRVKESYYRSFAEILRDADALLVNAQKFNRATSRIVTLASRLRSDLFDLVASIRELTTQEIPESESVGEIEAEPVVTNTRSSSTSTREQSGRQRARHRRVSEDDGEFIPNSQSEEDEVGDGMGFGEVERDLDILNDEMLSFGNN